MLPLRVPMEKLQPQLWFLPYCMREALTQLLLMEELFTLLTLMRGQEKVNGW